MVHWSRSVSAITQVLKMITWKTYLIFVWSYPQRIQFNVGIAGGDIAFCFHIQDWIVVEKVRQEDQEPFLLNVDLTSAFQR